MIRLSGSLSQSPIYWVAVDLAEVVFALVGHLAIETKEHGVVWAPAWSFR
jgi:hypothetical protein